MARLKAWCFICILVLSVAVKACDICEECRPVRWQRAAGVGIDLAMENIHTVVRDENGTHQSHSMPGSRVYKAVMKDLYEDVRNWRHNQPFSLTNAVYHVPEQKVELIPIFPNFPSRLFRRLRQEAQSLIPMLRPASPAETDPIVLGISSMLSTVKIVVDSFRPAIDYNPVLVSIPEWARYSPMAYERIALATRHAGFDLYDIKHLEKTTQSSQRLALLSHGFESCWESSAYWEAYNWSHESCDPTSPEFVTRFLVVENNYGVGHGDFSVSLWERDDDGQLGKVRGDTWVPDVAPLTFLEDDNRGFWETVGDYTKNLIRDVDIDKIILFGTLPRSTEVLNVLKTAFEDAGNEKAVRVLTQTVESSDGQESWEVCSAARGAAIWARRKMLRGEDTCWPRADCEIIHDEL